METENLASRLNTWMSSNGLVFTNDTLQVRTRIRALTKGGCWFEAGKGKFESFRDAEMKLGQTAIQFLQWNSSAECETYIDRLPDRHLTIHIPLRGAFQATHKGRHVQINPGEMLAVEAAGIISRKWSGRHDLLNLIISRETLKRAVATGLSCAGEGYPTFGPLKAMRLDNASTLFGLIETILLDFAGGRPQFVYPPIARPMEQALLLLLLKSVPNSCSDRMSIGTSAVPYYVRRAEQYIRAHLRQEMSIDDLIKASGVSGRTLFSGFEKSRDTTPMRYIKSLRLDQAQAALVSGQTARVKIADVANGVGYKNLSQFSRDYKRRYGETPRETLQGAQGS
jgi:AraC-like DNA-binding protein